MKKRLTKLNSFLDRIADRLPSRLIGDKAYMRQKYVSVYSNLDTDDLIINVRRKTARLYLLLIVITLAILIAFTVKLFISPEYVIDLERNSYEGDTKNVRAEIKAEYGGETQRQDANIVIRPKGLTETEKLERMEKTKRNLPSLIIGENTNLSNVTSNLELVTVDSETGVEIAWNSSNEDILNEEGLVNPLLAKDGEPIILDADLRIDEILDHVKLSIDFGKPESGSELSGAINASINNMIDKMSESDKGDRVKLPEKTQEGVSLKWKPSESTGIITQLALVIAVAVIIYCSRYNILDKKIKETRDSIIKDFPDFINKLVLLLNAGMVVTAAFEKITDDYRSRSKNEDKRHLYEEFCNMQDNIRMANSGFLVEMNEIAQRSGVKDVMRFNTIIADNIDKGSGLVEKLQSEGRILWTNRIKLAEEKGRLAETKLTFPMVLQLLVLIIITITPAVMEM